MEPDKQWVLTPFELHREAFPLPADNYEIEITPRFLESEIYCAICLDILRNTRTSKECLHRFCDECITQALRSGNKECPNCRKKLVSRRSLRPDPTIDAIIRCIFPNRAEMEKQQDDFLAIFTKNGARKFLPNMEAHLRHQAEQRGGKGSRTPRKIKNNGSDIGNEAGMSASASETGSQRGGTQEPFGDMDSSDMKVDEADSPVAGSAGLGKKLKKKKKTLTGDDSVALLEIIPAKCDKKKYNRLTVVWKKRFVRVGKTATVGHLCKFIQERLTSEPKFHSDFNDDQFSVDLETDKITIQLRLRNGQRVDLDPKFDLVQVQELYGVSKWIKVEFAITGSTRSKT